MTDLSHLTPLELALLRKVAKSPGLRKKELRAALNLTEHTFRKVKTQLQNEDLLTIKDASKGRVHEFYLGSTVDLNTVKAEWRRRNKTAVDPQARTAIQLIHEELQHLVSELGELLAED